MENLKNIAYCSLFCPECYKMTVSAAATNLKCELKNPHLCGNKLKLPDGFVAGLDKLIDLKCTKFCRAGGGNPECPIRICCIEKKVNGCWECKDFESCELLTPQYVKQIKKIKKSGLKKYQEVKAIQ